MDEFEVDYDKNVTGLYSSISNSEWDQALIEVKERPEEARTWVVRFHPNSDSIMWRFLPIHSACAKDPPEIVLNALVNAYRRGAQCFDDQGMLPLHYACGNQASLEVIRLLLLANPEGSSVADPHGMLPLHYLAQWGPSSIQALDVILFANRDAPFARDSEGSTPLELAQHGEYPERDEVVEVLQKIPEPPTELPIRSPVARREKKYETQKEEGNDAISRLRAAAAAQEKTREEYTSRDSQQNDNRDDESVLGALPRIAQAMSSSLDNDNSPFPTRSLNYANRSIEETPTLDSNTDAKKMVSELKLEVEKLRAEATLAEADAEKTINEERNKMQTALDEMKANLAKSVEEKQESASHLAEREEYGKLVESRLEDKENQLNAGMKKNETLRKDLDTVKKDISTYKSKTSTLDEHLNTLSKTMEGMMKEQEHIMKASIRHEEHMKKVAIVRQQKMQELIDQEVLFAKNSLEKQKQNELGSEEMINEAMEKQQKLMAAVASVLSESRQN